MIRLAFLVVVLIVLTAALAAPQHDNRIVGGSTAQRGAFPHQVSIQGPNGHFCGGSIITPYKVLTAAHCIYGNQDPMIIVVGTNSLNGGGEAYQVVQALYHGEYNPQSMLNDVAMLTLDLPIAYNDVVRPIRLSNVAPNPYTTLTLSGWGLTSYPGTPATELQYIQLQTLDITTCADALRPVNVITSNHVCTISLPGFGACQGDSGGPLIDSMGIQVGVVSWGIPCAKGNPDVFTSVAYHLGWIQSQL